MGLSSHVLKRLARHAPTTVNRVWPVVYPLFRKPERWDGSEYDDDLESTFTLIHDENRWGSTESVSGAGSTWDQTIIIRRELPKLLERMKLTSLLDAPCGDFHWMRQTPLGPDVAYTGGDIVRPLIDRLQARYGGDRRRFVHLDIVTDRLPDCDLWLCRDVLFHLSQDDIVAVLKNFVRSGIGYILTTTYDFARENTDIGSGGFRFINLRKPPFDLPPPILRIDDYLAPEPPRRLGLWSRDQIAQAIGKDRHD